MLHTQKMQGNETNPRYRDVLGLLYHRARTLCRPGLAIFVFLLASIVAWPQAQHSIVVGWATYVQGADVAVGFNVYRGTISGGPYTKQNVATIPLTTLSYTDTSGTGNTKYFYVVRAVDAIGIESPNSAEVSATMLGTPLAPVGVTAVSQ